jgi:membrane associated rhomboid family serine protease
MKRGSWSENADISLVVIGVLWVVFLLDYFLPFHLGGLGIRPREIVGLRGILLCPLLHGSFSHLIANSVGLFVLLSLSLTMGRVLTVLATAVILLLGGMSVWLFGRSGSVHIGASGWVFGLIGFLSASGIFRLEWRAFFYAVLALFLYGGSLITLFQDQPGVSWISHAAGFVAGGLAAWWFRKMPAR